MRLPHNFEARIQQVHDHLYANANIRTPEELQGEVAKLILSLAWMGSTLGIRSLSRAEKGLILKADPATVAAVAQEVHTGFKQYKRQHKSYPASEKLLLDDGCIAYARAALDEINIGGTDRDWLGDALEVFRSTAAKRLGGQFFTDQRVTELAVCLLRYDARKDDFVDVCAGTGGFLIAAARQAQRQGSTDNSRIFGIEVDPKLAHLAGATLRQLEISTQNLVHVADSLLEPTRWPSALSRVVAEGRHRCLASNPPFGSKITIKDPAVLKNFELGHAWRKRGDTWVRDPDVVSARPPDILFLERNLKLAEPGKGRVALVIPYQILSGPKLGFVREWLLRHARILAIVDLPDDTFQPWTGTKTSLLVMERRKRPLEAWVPENYPVFMAIAEHIGHDRRGRPILDGNGDVKTDLPKIAQAFKSYTAGKDPSQVHPSAIQLSAERFRRDNDLRMNAAYHEPKASALRVHFSSETKGAPYRIVQLRDVVKSVFCPGRFKRNYVDEAAQGVLFLGGSNISQLISTNRKYLSKDDRHLEEMLVREGWLLVTRSGSTGIVSSVPGAWDGLAMSEHVIRIIPDKRKLHPGYLEAYLRSDLGQRLLAAGVFGSVIDEITPEHVAQLQIPIPTDPAHLEQIASHQQQANVFRNKSMSLIGRSLASFDELVGRHVDCQPSSLHGLPGLPAALTPRACGPPRAAPGFGGGARAPRAR